MHFSARGNLAQCEVKFHKVAGELGVQRCVHAAVRAEKLQDGHGIHGVQFRAIASASAPVKTGIHTVAHRQEPVHCNPVQGGRHDQGLLAGMGAHGLAVRGDDVIMDSDLVSANLEDDGTSSEVGILLFGQLPLEEKDAASTNTRANKLAIWSLENS